MCGGTFLSSGYGSARQGLSPRVRGNLEPKPIGESSAQRVYPRVCGGTVGDDLLMRMRISSRVSGSIPACAGEPLPHRITGMPSARSIPACAGEPCALSQSCDSFEGLSPRVRGNRFGCRLALSSGKGLSPRVRGNRTDDAERKAIVTVYPRVCGGTMIEGQNATMPAGSIPACAGEPLSAMGSS